MPFTLITKLTTFFHFSLTPKSRFKVGEMVVHDEIVYPLVIKRIVRSLRSSDPLLYCQWFDKSTQETRMKLLHQSTLRPFDWSKG